MVEQVSTPKWAKSWIIYAICLVVAFCFLLVCSSNSFLYSFNDWVDLNCYLTIGKGMLDGKVIYKDMYDHKGPITYFIYAFYAMFPNAFYVVFICEVISFSLFLLLSYYIFRRYLTPYLSVIGIILLAMIVGTSEYFGVGGGAVEEYALPIHTYFLMILLKVFEKEKIKRSHYVLIGILMSILFWIKYTMVIMPAIVMLVWLINVIVRKEFKRNISNILYLLLGFVIITVPIFIYFIFNGALSDLFITYFYNNLFLYKNKINVVKNFTNLLFFGFFTTCLIVIGIVFAFKQYGAKGWLYLTLIGVCILYLMIFYTFIYYFLPLTVFSILGIAFILTNFSLNINKICKVLILILLSTTCFSSTFLFGNGVDEMMRPKSEYVQFEVAQDIKNFGIDNPSLFCYKMMDYGFYNAAGIVPDERFFMKCNFRQEDFPEMYQSFNEAIIEQRNDFVIVLKKTYLEETEFLEQYYDVYKEYSYDCYGSRYSFSKVYFILLIKS